MNGRVILTLSPAVKSPEVIGTISQPVAVQEKKRIWGNGLADAFVRACACPLRMCVAL